MAEGSGFEIREAPQGVRGFKSLHLRQTAASVASLAAIFLKAPYTHFAAPCFCQVNVSLICRTKKSCARQKYPNGSRLKKDCFLMDDRKRAGIVGRMFEDAKEA